MGRALSRPLRVSAGRYQLQCNSFIKAVCGCRLNPSLIGEVFSSLAARCISQSGSVLRRLYLRPQPQTTTISPGTKDSYTHPTTPSAGRTGGVLTCLTKSPHKIENGQSHPCFTHFLLHYYELKIISLPITLHYAISHGLAPRIFHSHL